MMAQVDGAQVESTRVEQLEQVESTRVEQLEQVESTRVEQVEDNESEEEEESEFDFACNSLMIHRVSKTRMKESDESEEEEESEFDFACNSLMIHRVSKARMKESDESEEEESTRVESTRVEQLEQVESTQVVGTMEKWLREFSEGQHRTPYISRRSRPHPSTRSPTDFVREPFLYSSESEEEEGDEIIFASDLIKISNEFNAIREENTNLKSDNEKMKK